MKNKKHILFLITSMRYGGAERVTANLIKYFSGKKEYRATLMLLEDVIEYALPGDIRIERLHPRQSGLLAKALSVLSDPFRLKGFIRRENVDTVISFMQRPNAINMLARMLGAGHKACVNVRCSMKEHYKMRSPLFRVTGKTIFKWLWRFADITIANSRIIRDEVIELFSTDPERVRVIYNPLDLEDIKRKSRNEVGEDWRKDGAPVIINVGRFVRAKGHSHLLRAFARLAGETDARLVLIGGGPLKDKMVSLAGELGIKEKVSFMGWQENPYKYLARSTLFVLSSIYEGFPNVLTEAMACGCPVVAFNCVSGPSEILLPSDDKREITKARYGILVRRIDEGLLAAAMCAMLNDKDMLAEYAAAGRDRAREFDLSRISGEFEKALYMC
jgi:N-acetylgalactosamine-N,N'-diacetylbacillosaminyl-diphospho-undecaprenol 4-alpha-N-acetylgalactosaminyltransferase